MQTHSHIHHHDDHLRLIRQANSWCVLQRLSDASSYKREIWKPISKQLTIDQANHLLQQLQHQNG